MSDGSPSLLSLAYGPGALVACAFASRPGDGYFAPVVNRSDDLAAALPLCLGGPDITLTATAACVSDAVWSLLVELGVPLCDRSRVLPFPPGLDSSLGRDAWMDAITAHLLAVAAPGSLVMAQPAMSPELASRFRLPPTLSQALNDKVRHFDLVPASAPPPRLAVYADGAAFSRAPWPGMPCVVKVSGSCSGLGVRRVADAAAWGALGVEWSAIALPILVERWVVARRNLDVELVVPADPAVPARVVGAVEQVSDAEGRLIGGVCRPACPAPTLGAIEAHLLGEVVPCLRALGWHGMGAYDILIDEDEQAHFIDPNFRLTDFTTALWRSRSLRAGESSLILPFAEFDGGLDDFRRHLAPLSQEADPDQLLQVHAIHDAGGDLLLSASLRFAGPDQLRTRAREVAARGLVAPALDAVEALLGAPALGAGG